MLLVAALSADPAAPLAASDAVYELARVSCTWAKRCGDQRLAMDECDSLERLKGHVEQMKAMRAGPAFGVDRTDFDRCLQAAQQAECKKFPSGPEQYINESGDEACKPHLDSLSGRKKNSEK